jgi:UDP-N-acetylglucosamine 2-epimerase (non-hydrolysing)
LLTVLSVIGTRPEAVKMAPVIRRLGDRPDRVRSVVCSTGQHGAMLRQILDLFEIRPAVELDVMQPDQTLSGLTSRLLAALDSVVEQFRPDWVLAQGDTTSVLVASLVAFYQRIPFGHVEAGLRTGNLSSPFPEEFNRCVADKAARLMFAPTERSRQVLLSEGHPAEHVLLTGNTVIDALHQVTAMPYDWSAGPLGSLPAGKRFVLVTAHRRESFGKPFGDLCHAIRDLSHRFAGDGVQFVYPVHLNPNVRRPVGEILSGLPNVCLMEPLDYLSLVQLMKRSTLILTDSGGIQEEAPAFGVPTLVMRDTTERPEGVEAGVAQLVGTDRARIVLEAERLLTDPVAHRAMAKSVNPYGDGKAASRIVSAILENS